MSPLLYPPESTPLRLRPLCMLPYPGVPGLRIREKQPWVSDSEYFATLAPRQARETRPEGFNTPVGFPHYLFRVRLVCRWCATKCISQQFPPCGYELASRSYSLVLRYRTDGRVSKGLASAALALLAGPLRSAALGIRGAKLYS